MRRANRMAVTIAALGAAAALACPMRLSAAPLTIAVADFDYIDTSGEVKDQRAAHQARMAQFAELLRAKLGADGQFQVMPLACAEPPCTPINMQPDRFIAASRSSSARYIVYGGIHKTSTLVQWGDIELLDLEANKLLLKRTVTFRGDTDEAFSRAAAFVSETVKEAMKER